MISSTRFTRTIVSLTLILLFTQSRAEDDPLHKRVFHTSLSETKKDIVAKKVIDDEITFKNGKLRSNFLYNKFGYKWLKYRINKDSIYTDSTDTEVRLLEVEAVNTDESNQTVEINFILLEWGMDGVIRITKNDKVKRYYDLIGREKGGKPPKKKKEKSNEDGEKV